MAFDTKAWLTDLGFSAEEATELAPKFEPRVGALEKHQLRQADYSRQMNEISKLQTDLKTNSERLNREMAEWAEIKASDSAQANQIREQLEKTQLEKFQLEQALIRTAEQAGVDPRTLVPQPSPEPKPKPEPEPFNPDKFAQPIMQTVGGIADYVMSLTAELPAIMAEHQALTGEVLDSRKFIDELKSRASRKEDVDPRRVWETLYQIPDKRDAARQAKYEADLKAAEDRGRQAARSEMAIPGQTTPGHSAPIFTQMGTATSKLPRPPARPNVAQYAQSLATHKYRTTTNVPAPASAAHGAAAK